MHDIRLIRDNPEPFVTGLIRRGSSKEEAQALLDRLLGLDDRRRAAIAAAQSVQERRNALSREVGEAKKAKDEARAQALMAEVAALKDKAPELEAEERDALAELDRELAAIPNTPLDEVPTGADEHDNVEHHQYGAKRNYAFTPKQHFEVGEGLGLMDFETAAKLSGARFVVLKGGLARLERALGQFMLDVHTGEHGYTEVNPPLLVRDDAMFGTAQLPKFRDDQFAATNLDLFRQGLKDPSLSFEEFRDLALRSAPKAAGLGAVAEAEKIESSLALAYQWILRGAEESARKAATHWLIPTAEVPLTNLVRESILSEEELPKRFTALTPCFRAEAGSAGRDTRGMIRQHQFTKVELVSITTPETSGDEHERMLAAAEEILKRLELHYRVVTLCTGDMGFASQKTYDIEVWLPGQNAYREISSCSVCGDFQARRMQARFRAAGAKQTRLVHTLNGSGTAVGRALVAVLETWQNEDGSVTIPPALRPYMMGQTTLERPA
ncbi:MAG: serine--tRNA ligase [Chelatococcus sp.]|uniref:serine--tRNA ligase n=1 Tax=Chelatococcus sp. TaxID=1953771 RepID=UPI0025BEC2B3|nr:serine--tRNA ligase [Chelatococcus sp.]MBX3537832.1 serine--tRNA ligase [Chelatococcus sp.]